MAVETTSNLLLHSARTGDLKDVKNLVEDGANINVQESKHGFSPLMLASFNNHRKIVEFLLNNKAQVDLREEHGRTALMTASANGHYKIVKLLLENDANYDLQDNDGITALMIASQQGYSKIVKLLVDKGVDSSLKANDGNLAYDFAVETGNKKIMDLVNSKLHVDQVRGNETSGMKVVKKTDDGAVVKKNGKLFRVANIPLVLAALGSFAVGGFFWNQMRLSKIPILLPQAVENVKPKMVMGPKGKPLPIPDVKVKVGKSKINKAIVQEVKKDVAEEKDHFKMFKNFLKDYDLSGFSPTGLKHIEVSLKRLALASDAQVERKKHADKLLKQGRIKEARENYNALLKDLVKGRDFLRDTVVGTFWDNNVHTPDTNAFYSFLKDMLAAENKLIVGLRYALNDIKYYETGEGEGFEDSPRLLNERKAEKEIEKLFFPTYWNLYKNDYVAVRRELEKQFPKSAKKLLKMYVEFVENEKQDYLNSNFISKKKGKGMVLKEQNQHAVDVSVAETALDSCGSNFKAAEKYIKELSPNNNAITKRRFKIYKRLASKKR